MPLPYRENQPWANWGRTAQLGHFMSVLLVWPGRPSETWYHFALGAVTLIGAVGLYGFWRVIFAKPAA